LMLTSRFEAYKGVDVSSANDLTLGSDGNAFVITGTTQVNAITTTNWQAGSVINLKFSGALTVKNNTAGGAATAPILLSGGSDFTTAANDGLTLWYDGTSWNEASRKVTASATGANFANANLTLTGARTHTFGTNQMVFSSTNTTTSPALSIQVTSGAGLGVSTNGLTQAVNFTQNGGGQALTLNSTSGDGIKSTTSNGGISGHFITENSTTNTNLTILKLERTTSGTAANSMSGSVDIFLESNSGNSRQTTQLISKWLDATDASRTSASVITGTNNGIAVDILELGGTGYMKLNPITATAASAITASDGMILYASNTDATFTSVGFWGYQGGSWQKL
jgi:hypothetical protein